MRRRMGVAVTLAMRKGGGEFVFVDLTNRSNGKTTTTTACAMYLTRKGGMPTELILFGIRCFYSL